MRVPSIQINPAMKIPDDPDIWAMIGLVALLREQIASLLRMAHSGLVEPSEKQVYLDRGRNNKTIDLILHISQRDHPTVHDLALIFKQNYHPHFLSASKIVHGMSVGGEEDGFVIFDQKEWKPIKGLSLEELILHLDEGTRRAKSILVAVCEEIIAGNIQERGEGPGPNFRWRDRWVRL
jgi:hypothetical protein